MLITLKRLLLRSSVLTIIVVFSVSLSTAQVMTSSNFRVQSDSINSGGLFSSSTNYSLEDTAGEVATGEATSTNYQLKAGYQQMQEVFLSLSNVNDVVMSPSLPGITGGVATGSASFKVITDSPSGYSITIEASNNPAMQSDSSSILDYVPVGLVPDFSFVTDVNDYHFGYSPEGPDIALRYQDFGGVCGVSGSDSVDSCWDGLSMSPNEIVNSSSPNHPLGATTTIKFRVGLGGGTAVPAGDYIATTTITALPI